MKVSQILNEEPLGDSRWMETKAPGAGLVQGKKSGFPSSMKPWYLLQSGLLPKSGRLFPTRTAMVAFCRLAVSGSRRERELSEKKVFVGEAN